MQGTYAYMAAYNMRTETAYPYTAAQGTCKYSTTSTTGSTSKSTGHYGPYSYTDPELIKGQVYANPVVMAIAVANSF